MRHISVKPGGIYLHPFEHRLWTVKVMRVSRNREYPANHPMGWEWYGVLVGRQWDCDDGFKCWGYTQELLQTNEVSQ